MLRFWFLLMDLFHAIGWQRAYLWAVGKASDTIDWVDDPPTSVCDHGVTFDDEAARGLSASEVRKRWPRGFGVCPKGCGWDGCYYASYEHYIAGDW